MKTPPKSPQFRNLIKEMSKELILGPILHTYLYDAKYPEHTVTFKGGSSYRPPDGWFHPSTHPLWTARQLYWYLVAPEKMVPETMEYMGALSTTMGTAVHSFIQTCLHDHGCLIDDEVYVEDEETRSRGSMDGLLRLPQFEGLTGLEFKTSNMMKLNGFNDNDVDLFRKKWPEYYYQVQEYMRLSGLRRFIVLFLGMGYPWTIKECLIEYDPQVVSEIGDKYRYVIKSVEAGVAPEPCCSPRSKIAADCMARNVCPVGLA